MNDAPLAVRSASLSDVGRRRTSNQDFCGEFERRDGSWLLVCCDGMGGHQGGETASRLAVETIAEVVLAEERFEPETLLERALQEAHQRIQRQARDEPALRGMGTTVVAMLYAGGAEAWVAHVGDARLYRIRGGRAEQLTQDHSIVAEQLRRGLITSAQASQMPHNELSRALGASAVLEVDVARHEAEDGDRFVLCSDGLWNLVSERELAEAVLQGDPEQAVHALVARANERGGTDNVTVQVLQVGHSAPLPPLEEDVTESSPEDVVALARLREGAGTSSIEEPARTGGTPDQLLQRESRQIDDKRSVRQRRIRSAAVASIVVALLLFALLWLGTQLKALDEVDPSRAPVSAPPASSGGLQEPP